MATDVITISTRASRSEIDAANRRLGVSAWADWGRLSLLGVVLFLHFCRRQSELKFEGLEQVCWHQGLRGELARGRQLRQAEGATLRRSRSGKCANNCQSISAPFGGADSVTENLERVMHCRALEGG